VERRLGSLDFGTHERAPEPGAKTTAALVERIIETTLDALPWTPAARNLQQRAVLIAEHRPDIVANPIDDATLITTADEVFGPYLHGAVGRKDLDKLDVLSVLRAHLGWAGTQEIDRLAPTTLELPGGRTAKITYTTDGPRISTRAQDLSGLAETPTVVEGAVPITVELLSPANRPIQVTSDLGTFWTGSWAEVRKDMAGRYPKHDWPENPQAV